MEFKVTTDLSVISPQTISFNKAELSAYLDDKLAKYRGRVFTDDEIEEAKKARALINKVEKAMNDEKIRVKKAFTAPYTVFEDDVKELMGKCSEVSTEIDKQVKEYENAIKAAKKAALVAHFTSEIGIASDFVIFDDIFDPKWLNATVAEETAKEQITEICERFKGDVGALKAIEAEPATKVVLEQRYKATKSLADVLRMKNDIEARAKLEAENAERRAAERAAAQTVAQPSIAPMPEQHFTRDIAPTEPTKTVRFQITTTPAKLALLKQFLLDNEIPYGPITD